MKDIASWLAALSQADLTSSIVQLPVAFDVLEAATIKCIKGYVPEFVEAPREPVSSGMAVFTLHQRELGDVGKVELRKLADHLTEVEFFPPQRLPREVKEVYERRRKHQRDVIRTYFDCLRRRIIWPKPAAQDRPGWFPKGETARKRWRKAYRVICAMQKEYLDTELKPQLGDYRDRLKINKLTYSLKSIGYIIQAGDKGWLT